MILYNMIVKLSILKKYVIFFLSLWTIFSLEILKDVNNQIYFKQRIYVYIYIYIYIYKTQKFNLLDQM